MVLFDWVDVDTLASSGGINYYHTEATEWRFKYEGGNLTNENGNFTAVVYNV